jgi:hypothetical protein
MTDVASKAQAANKLWRRPLRNAFEKSGKITLCIFCIDIKGF